VSFEVSTAIFKFRARQVSNCDYHTTHHGVDFLSNFDSSIIVPNSGFRSQASLPRHCLQPSPQSPKRYYHDLVKVLCLDFPLLADPLHDTAKSALEQTSHQADVTSDKYDPSPWVRASDAVRRIESEKSVYIIRTFAPQNSFLYSHAEFCPTSTSVAFKQAAQDFNQHETKS
jgi:hypothetical protein